MYLQVNNVINPVKKGGTGNFQVSSKKGSNTIDENLIFGTIGIGQYPNLLTSTIVQIDPSGGSSYAGDSSSYIFGFKLVSFVPSGSYFRLTMPLGQGYTVSAAPACSFLPVLGVTPSGTLTCSYSDGQILVRGLGQDLKQGTVLSIKVAITNPPQAIDVPLFRMEVMRDKTQYIYDWVDLLPGPAILPGKLSSVSVTPAGASADLAMGKTETLTLTFTTKNKVPQGGMITVYVPTSFAFVDLKVYDKPVTYYVISGLTAANSSVGITLTYEESTTT